ncbi:gamma-glutamyltransferase family protein [Nonomuraea jiangxiensis]|uniref:Gamma-glutamyltranspeptidase / glutathione hydrolase n=1 Tax=Nonomuraea jiangxiensis TaxID=633440 RepID=A0A1G7ZTF3_9ACTN|nr:gamma-glutamyltransferase [Nonomuraea jiangxiensis]SDH11420.1 gamma-glutamyltranspeptidase / glutathione hydrolase [Nonomuraea jiangxiensis]
MTPHPPGTFVSIASPHHLATQAGEEAFRAGGNAIDAAVTAAVVLNVVYPNNTALGGDLVALVRTPDGTLRCVNATGPAPAAQSLARLRERHGDELPTRGIDTVTVPGGVRGWASLRSFGARLEWAAQFTAAIRFAEEGVPVARSVAASLAEKHDVLLADPGCREVFASLAEGDLLRQPALARSLAELRTGGPGTLYGGPLGRRLVAGLAQRGSVMTIDDLAAFRPEVVEPLRGRFRDYEVLTSPPNTQGFMLLRALEEVRRLGDPGDLLGAGSGRLAAIFEHANAVRDLLLADPNFAKVDAADLITRVLDPAERPPGPGRAGGDTVGISAIDSDGYAVSLIQSVYNSFGSAVLEPSTGILMQNRGRSFSLDPLSPNVVEPGKRPRHTLMPVLVTQGAEVRWVSSTMGGHGQPQIHAQLLLRSMAGAAPREAVDAPRWIVGVQEGGDTNRTVYMEEDLPADTARSLLDHGFTAKPVPPHDEWLGHANLIRVAPDGRVEAASDPRADGSAAVIDG